MTRRPSSSSSISRSARARSLVVFVAVVASGGLAITCSLDGLEDGGGSADSSVVARDGDVAADDAAPVSQDAGDAGDAADGGDSADSGPMCDPTAAFGPGAAIAELDDAGLDQGSVRLDPGETTLAFTRLTAPDLTYDLYTATRGDGGIFGTPAPLAGSGVNTADQDEYSPNLADDGLSIVFERQMHAGTGSALYFATRSDRSAVFGMAAPLTGLAASTYTAQPFARGDLSTLSFVQVNGNMEIEVDEATSPGGASGRYTAHLLLSPSTAGPGKSSPVLSADGRWLCYSDAPADGGSNLDMYLQPVDGSDPPLALAALNTRGDERCGWISLDSCRLYYDSDGAKPGGPRSIYVASRPRP